MNRRAIDISEKYLARKILCGLSEMKNAGRRKYDGIADWDQRAILHDAVVDADASAACILDSRCSRKHIWNVYRIEQVCHVLPRNFVVPREQHDTDSFLTQSDSTGGSGFCQNTSPCGCGASVLNNRVHRASPFYQFAATPSEVAPAVERCPLPETVGADNQRSPS